MPEVKVKVLRPVQDRVVLERIVLVVPASLPPSLTTSLLPSPLPCLPSFLLPTSFPQTLLISSLLALRVTNRPFSAPCHSSNEAHLAGASQTSRCEELALV